MDFGQDRKKPAERVAGIATVVLFHAVIGYALVNGLARKIVEVVKAPIETKIIEDVKPPPPDTPPPPPPKLVAPPPPVYIPPPEVIVQVQIQPSQSAITAVTNMPQPVSPSLRQTVGVRVPPIIDAARSCKPPDYPASARRLGQAGTVMLRFLIGIDGRVIESKVESSSGFERLDQAAINALSQCQFKAGTLDGKPEQSWASLKYVWQLQ